MSEVSCGKCGKPLDDDLRGDRKPCPDCGSLTRKVAASLHSMAVASARMEASVVTEKMRSIAPVADLLLQAVVVAGDRTTEGKLIEAVAVPWFSIVDHLVKDPSLAFQIDPRKWEEIVAGAYSKAGFEEVTLTPRRWRLWPRHHRSETWARDGSRDRSGQGIQATSPRNRGGCQSSSRLLKKSAERALVFAFAA